jgi:hypothetical protein
MDSTTIEVSRRIISMLERLSADSPWAHRASGLRGALLRSLADLESQGKPMNTLSEQETEIRLAALNQAGFDILTRAAQEIRTPELQDFLRRYSDTGK